MNEPARNKFDRHPEPLKRICGGGGEFSARASPAGPLGNLAAGRCRSAKKKTAIAAEKCGFHESLRNQGSQSDMSYCATLQSWSQSLRNQGSRSDMDGSTAHAPAQSQSLRNQGSRSDQAPSWPSWSRFGSQSLRNQGSRSDVVQFRNGEVSRVSIPSKSGKPVRLRARNCSMLTSTCKGAWRQNDGAKS